MAGTTARFSNSQSLDVQTLNELRNYPSKLPDILSEISSNLSLLVDAILPLIRTRTGVDFDGTSSEGKLSARPQPVADPRQAEGLPCASLKSCSPKVNIHVGQAVADQNNSSVVIAASNSTNSYLTTKVNNAVADAKLVSENTGEEQSLCTLQTSHWKKNVIDSNAGSGSNWQAGVGYVNSCRTGHPQLCRTLENMTAPVVSGKPEGVTTSEEGWTSAKSLVDSPKESCSVSLTGSASVVEETGGHLKRATSWGLDGPTQGSCASDNDADFIHSDHNKRRRHMSSGLSGLPDDGYSWRKYGQKILTDSSYIRSYHWCSRKSSGCSARKWVDRQPNGVGPVRISHEGKHNHPRPTVAIQEVVYCREGVEYPSVFSGHQFVPISPRPLPVSNQLIGSEPYAFPLLSPGRHHYAAGDAMWPSYLQTQPYFSQHGMCQLVTAGSPSMAPSPPPSFQYVPAYFVSGQALQNPPQATDYVPLKGFQQQSSHQQHSSMCEGKGSIALSEDQAAPASPLGKPIPESHVPAEGSGHPVWEPRTEFSSKGPGRVLCDAEQRLTGSTAGAYDKLVSPNGVSVMKSEITKVESLQISSSGKKKNQSHFEEACVDAVGIPPRNFFLERERLSKQTCTGVSRAESSGVSSDQCHSPLPSVKSTLDFDAGKEGCDKICEDESVQVEMAATEDRNVPNLRKDDTEIDFFQVYSPPPSEDFETLTSLMDLSWQ